jgi:hypothetical protein
MRTTQKTSGLPWSGMSDRAEISNCSRPAEAWPRGSTVDRAGPVTFAAGFQIVPAEIRAHAMLRYQILFK